MIQIAAKVAEYFGTHTDRVEEIENPVIIGAFGSKSRNWIPINGRVATVGNIRALAKQGAESVEIHFAGRSADFTCDEIIRYAERSLLGGRVI